MSDEDNKKKMPAPPERPKPDRDLEDPRKIRDDSLDVVAEKPGSGKKGQ